MFNRGNSDPMVRGALLEFLEKDASDLAGFETSMDEVSFFMVCEMRVGKLVPTVSG